MTTSRSDGPPLMGARAEVDGVTMPPMCREACGYYVESVGTVGEALRAATTYNDLLEVADRLTLIAERMRRTVRVYRQSDEDRAALAQEGRDG